MGQLKQGGHTHPHHLNGQRRIFVPAEVGDGPGHSAKEGHRDSWNEYNKLLLTERGLFSMKAYVTENKLNLSASLLLTDTVEWPPA